jgi:glycosyltransferase involved in cell wall biosynthesis
MKKKIKILHIIKTLNLGGAETNLLNLVQALDNERFEIHVAYSFGGEIEERFKAAGVKTFKYAKKNHKIKSLASLMIISRIAGYIIRNKIQIVHTHIFNAQIWGGIAAKLTGIKVVEHVHDFRYLDADEVRRRKGLYSQYQYIKYFKDFSDAVVILTRQNLEFLVANKLYKKDKVHHIYNGMPIASDSMNLSDKESIKKNYHLHMDSKVVFIASRFVQPKNIDLIFRVAPVVARDIPQVIFLIAGDGELYDEFRSQCERSGLNDVVKIIGFQSNIRELLLITDIYMSSSFLELHSISMLEAMSMKIPVVVSDGVGSNNEFIKNWDNGVLLDPFNDQGWAEAVTKLLKEPALMQQIGENGYQTCVSLFDIHKTARKFEKVYDHLIR